MQVYKFISRKTGNENLPKIKLKETIFRPNFLGKEGSLSTTAKSS
jgi:hypothetical protein